MVSVLPLNEDALLLRKQLISAMDDVFNKQSGIKFAVLTGAGGAGKTTAARTYLHTHDFDLKWEINAETSIGISDSFINLAVALADTKELRDKLSYILAISDNKIRSRQIALFVFTQLKRFKNWCLLFDNIDDFNAAALFIPTDSNLCGAGKVIITTRNENIKNAAFLNETSIINVGDLHEQEGIELFCNILYGKNMYISDNIKEEAQKLLREIPTMPLDISAAAYYIKNMQITCDEYIKTACGNRESDKIAGKFIEESSGYSRSRYDIITFIFNDILKKNDDFKELLLLICLLDSQGIPLNLLEKHKNRTTVQEFLHQLRRFSLISTGQGTFSLHRSVQKIGLKYIFAVLTAKEKEEYIDRAVETMTPYNKIAWYLYENQREKMTIAQKAKMMQHLQAMEHKIGLLSLDEKKKKEYRIKLSLALLHSYKYFKSSEFIHRLAEEILKLNDETPVLKETDLAVLLEICGNKCIFPVADYKKAEQYLNRCLKICEKTDHSGCIRAVCLSDYAKLFSISGNFDKAKQYLGKAMEIASGKEPWQLQTKVTIFNRYHECFTHYCVCSQELRQVVEIGMNLLRQLSEDESCRGIQTLGSDHTLSVFLIKRNLAALYNRLGEFEKAWECENVAKSLLEKMRKSDIYLTNHGATLDIDFGCTLLRLNRFAEAFQRLDNCINIKNKIGEKSVVPYALMYRAEIYIRENKLEEASRDCLKALELIGDKATSNTLRFSAAICYYTLAVIGCRLHDYTAAVSDLVSFFEIMKSICGAIIDKNVYDQLKNEGIFDCSKDTARLRLYMQNATTLFDAIYGNSHPFVKDFVSKN
jgi:tetratricopeptide (TPR) repeat protein